MRLNPISKGWGRGLTSMTQLLPTDGPVVVSALGRGYLVTLHGDTPDWTDARDAALRFQDVTQARRALRHVLLPDHAGVTLAPEPKA